MRNDGTCNTHFALIVSTLKRDSPANVTYTPMMEISSSFWSKAQVALHYVLFDIQGSQFTLLTLLYILVASLLLVWCTQRLARFLERRLLAGERIGERGRQIAGITIIRYSILVIGFLFIFNSAGFSFSTFSWLIGALGVGLGFGLQNITSNFVSGVIILLERPIKVGDRIQVEGVSGDVISISMRSTTIVTNDNISVIVPNNAFINGNVTNWSHNDRRVRFHYPVCVSYKEDPERVREVVLDVAKRHEGVMLDPPPNLLFAEYGDSSLNFELVVWTSSYIQKPAVLKSELYYEIFREFATHGIEIPYPQRDVHIRTGNLT